MRKKILVLTIMWMLSMFGVVSAAEFYDVPSNHWAYNDIKAMSNAGIINGRGNGTFDPNSKVTIEEFFAMTSRILQSKGLHPSESISFVPYLGEEMNAFWSSYDYRNLAFFILGQANTESGGAQNLSAGLNLINYQIAYDGRPLVGKGWDNYYSIQDLSRKWMQYFIMGRYGDDIVSNEVTKRYKTTITRQQAAALLGFFLSDNSTTDKNVVGAKDWLETRRTAGVNSGYRVYVNEAIERDVFRGSRGNDGALYLRPVEGLSRAEAAALLNRFYQQRYNI